MSVSIASTAIRMSAAFFSAVPARVTWMRSTPLSANAPWWQPKPGFAQSAYARQIAALP